MRRLATAGACGALVVLAGLALAAGDIESVKDIMVKLNKGPTCLTVSLKKGLQQNKPDWDDIQTQAKEYADLTAALAKADPPLGSKGSWAKLTKNYAETASALATAADKKNKTAALTAHQRLTQACMACHRVHRKAVKG
jgi:hypothetical protein